MKSASWACLWSPCWPGYRANILSVHWAFPALPTPRLPLVRFFFVHRARGRPRRRFAGLERFDPHAVGRVVAVWRRVCAGGRNFRQRVEQLDRRAIIGGGAAPLVVILLCLVALIVFLTEIQQYGNHHNISAGDCGTCAGDRSAAPDVNYSRNPCGQLRVYVSGGYPAQCHCLGRGR